jgi:predicted acyl esterase
MRKLTIFVAALAALVAAPAADAAVTTAFDGAVPCVAMTGGDAGRISCSTSDTSNPLAPVAVTTWDGQTHIDENLYLPSGTPPAGGWPLLSAYHGWGGAKLGIDSGVPDVRDFLNRGYAVFSMTDRGWGKSCGQTDPARITGAQACLNGYNRLLDDRYEVRDAQYLMGLLVDDGIVDPQRIGATGISYGGGMSMALAALKDRTMMPDGSLVAWTTPDGAHPRIAAAAPEVPWTDLANSLQPNGATLDYVADAPYKGPLGDKRIGILKQSFVAGLYGTGQTSSYYAPPGANPEADLTTWYASINAGEPYDSNPLSNSIVSEIMAHHSSYYIDHSEAPAPLLMANGWTDDIFPADETIRFYNRTRTQYPNAHMSLFYADFGHMRGSGGNGTSTHPAVRGPLRAAQNAWFDYFVKNNSTGTAPFQGVSTLAQRCPADPNNHGTLLQASTWAAAAPGEVRYDSAAIQPIASQGGSEPSKQAFDPIAGGGACASTSATDAPGIANYRLPTVATGSGGYTLLGSPTIVADFYSPGPNNQIAARLVDVAPSGNETLVDRGLWRPKVDNANAVPPTGTRQVFQLHPGRWHFDEGHIAKLELMPDDQPYGRNSNGQTPITVQNIELRLPVVETPGAAGGVVQAPAGKIVPTGYALARDFQDPTDTDGDGWPNDSDNCPATANGNQLDSDGDGVGDACDSTNDDSDGDGVSNTNDNCPSTSNPAQTDTDNDGIGDACDPSNDNDVDGDGVANASDNCPNDANPGQQDADGDGVGNACDSTDNNDLDGDGVSDANDNCVGVPNHGQQDSDGDNVGDACDSFNNLDFDNDGVANASDNCPNDVNPGQQNSDGDVQGDACDPDDDNDGTLDTQDACRTTPGIGADGCPPIAPLTPAAGGQQTTKITIIKKCRKKRHLHGHPERRCHKLIRPG